MKEKLEINSVRCSVFVPKVGYNSENIQKLMKLFPGYLPSVIDIIPKQLQILGLKMETKNIEGQPWQLVSSDSLMKIAFFDNKIDVTISFATICKYASGTLDEVAKKMSDVLKNIVGAFKFVPTRLAFAPTLVLPLQTGGSVQGFVRKVFAINAFEGSCLDNCEFNQLYRVSRQLDANNYMVNHLVKFNTEMVQRIDGANSEIFPLVKLEMDLNTLPRPDYSFSLDAINTFYNMASQWCDSLLNLYLS